MIHVYTLIAGIILCLLGLMMLVWTKNFIVLRYEGFQKLVRKQEFEIKYKKLNVFIAILYFIIAIPILIVGIIGFVTELDTMIFVWTFFASGALGIIGSLFVNISRQFIRPLDQKIETELENYQVI